MYISNVELSNFRCYKKAALQFRHPAEPVSDLPNLRCRNVTLLLGDNGSGKSSILKALALAVVGPIIRDSGYRPYFLVNRSVKSTKASVDAIAILHQQDIDKEDWGLSQSIGETRLHAEVLRRGDYESVLSTTPKGRGGNNIFQEQSPAFFVVGYGATRRVDEPGEHSARENWKSRSVRYQRIASLFEAQVSLSSLSSWLPQLAFSNKGRYAQFIKLFGALLPSDIKFTGKIVDRDYAFHIHGSDIPFSALSDGYRAYLGWISDLLFHVAATCPTGMKLAQNRGLVLIDEIDLYIHPIWQRTLISTISKALPNLQFVFTTHSPLVAASLQSENIFVTEYAENSGAIVRHYDERIYGLSADQTLESSYFGVPSTRSDEFLEDVRQLLARSSATSSSTALKMMDQLAGLGFPNGESKNKLSSNAAARAS